MRHKFKSSVLNQRLSQTKQKLNKISQIIIINMPWSSAKITALKIFVRDSTQQECHYYYTTTAVIYTTTTIARSTITTTATATTVLHTFLLLKGSPGKVWSELLPQVDDTRTLVHGADFLFRPSIFLQVANVLWGGRTD